VAAAGNQSTDLRHPILDTISPDGPEDVPITREVGNNCRVLPAELLRVLTVSATGRSITPATPPTSSPTRPSAATLRPLGGLLRGQQHRPGRDPGRGAPEHRPVPVARPLNATSPGITAGFGAATYTRINGTSMASSHVAGFAALVKELHPNWGPSALSAAVKRTAAPMSCPPNWPAVPRGRAAPIPGYR
jgi:lantibiotic leader peptide-processing serine protease